MLYFKNAFGRSWWDTIYEYMCVCIFCMYIFYIPIYYYTRAKCIDRKMFFFLFNINTI